jgi:hypothetical protein
LKPGKNVNLNIFRRFFLLSKILNILQIFNNGTFSEVWKDRGRVSKRLFQPLDFKQEKTVGVCCTKNQTVGSCECSNELSGFKKCKEFPD